MVDENNTSIYDETNDRIETSIDTSDDIFDDVFGEDEEKRKAKERMREKAKELLEKNETKNKENQEMKEKLEKGKDSFQSEAKNETKKIVTKTINEFDRKEISQSNKRLETISGKKKNNFNKIIDDGLKKTIENGSKQKKMPGKLDLKISFEENESKKENEAKQIINKLTNVEKNIVKSVIKNKAEKAVNKDDEIAEYLLREQGTKESDVHKNEFIEIKETSDEEKNELKIKPDLDFLVNDETGNAFIGRKKSVLKQYGEAAALFVGRVQENDLHHKPILLDGLNPHVVFVCGARGSGKSYVLGVIAEELAIKNKNVGIVVVDPIGVFWSMKHPNKEKRELELLADWEIMPRGLDNIKVFIPVGMKTSVPKSTFDETFSIQPSLLNAEDWCLTFGIDRFSPTGLLMEKGIFKVKTGYVTEEGKQVRGKQNTFSLEDLINCFTSDSELNDREKGYKTDSIRALISRFDAAKNWGIFDEKGTPLSILSRAGQMTILDTSFLEDNVSALVIGILSRRLLSARKLSTRREAAGKFAETTMDDLVELNVPPTWLFIDEAHTLIPGGNQKTPASSALVEYVKQGRRPGLSLVFATQQPSAIDSRVLSQLDIIMAHKLVFDDDVKAIWKRTPTIIPNAYKKPNFIKTLPVGTALTGDRQETTTRAFIMNIRPRMSQHEGRDAETIEVKHELSKDQVEVLSVSIVLKQLEKDPSISISSLEQTLDTLNNTYKQNLSINDLLKSLKKKGLNVDDERVYARGVLEEIREEELEKERIKNEEDGVENNIVESEIKETNINEEILDEKDEYEEKEFEEKIELIALKNNIVEKDARLLLVKYRLKKKFGLFGEEEILDRLYQKHGIIYKIKYNFLSQKDAFQVGEAYINSLTSEFIHDLNGKLVESKGLTDLIGLSEVEASAIKVLAKEHELKSIAVKLEMEDGNAKRVLDKLATKDLVKIKQVSDGYEYYLNKVFDLPANPLNAILPSIGKRPIIEVESIAIVPPRINETIAADLIKKWWKNIIVKEVTQIYLPVWEGVLKKQTGEERIIIIDGINGKQIS